MSLSRETQQQLSDVWTEMDVKVLPRPVALTSTPAI